jgi:hypothetical protein
MKIDFSTSFANLNTDARSGIRENSARKQTGALNDLLKQDSKVSNPGFSFGPASATRHGRKVLKTRSHA